MVSTTTKNARVKRPDTRPNGKLRRKLQQQNLQAADIQDIRVTRVKKSEQKERTYAPIVGSNLTTKEKRLRALKKKMTQINQLIERKDKGEIDQFDDQQKVKVDQLPSVLEEMKELMQELQG